MPIAFADGDDLSLSGLNGGSRHTLGERRCGDGVECVGGLPQTQFRWQDAVVVWPKSTLRIGHKIALLIVVY